MRPPKRHIRPCRRKAKKLAADLLKTGILMMGLLPIAFSAVPAGADIFSYVDENGVRHFSNTPTSARYEYLGPEIGKDRPARYGAPDRFDPYIRAAARSYGLDFALVKAVVCVESNFDPAAVSKAGAVGLMQIMPANFTEFRLHDPYNPRANIMAGARYLKTLLDRYDNNLELSLAAYNAGPTAVEHYNGVPPYAETQTYIKRVMGRYAEFKKSEGRS